MSAFELSAKLLEIKEMFGDRYGAMEYQIAAQIMEFALSLRVKENLCTRSSERYSAFECTDDLIKFYKQKSDLEMRKAKRYIDFAEKLEQKIAPELIALVRTLDVWTSFGSSEFEEYSTFAIKKEEISSYISDQEEQFEIKSKNDFDNLHNAEKNFEKSFREFLKDEMESPNLPELRSEALDAIDKDYHLMHGKLRDDFSNSQEYELARLFVDILMILERNVEKIQDDVDFLEKNSQQGSQSLIELALVPAQKEVESFRELAIEILKVYRITSHCLWRTLRESEAEGEDGDLFKGLSEYLTSAWEAMMRKAKVLVEPILELNELSLKIVEEIT